LKNKIDGVKNSKKCVKAPSKNEIFEDLKQELRFLRMI